MVIYLLYSPGLAATDFILPLAWSQIIFGVGAVRLLLLFHSIIYHFIIYSFLFHVLFHKVHSFFCGISLSCRPLVIIFISFIHTCVTCLLIILPSQHIRCPLNFLSRVLLFSAVWCIYFLPYVFFISSAIASLSVIYLLSSPALISIQNDRPYNCLIYIDLYFIWHFKNVYFILNLTAFSHLPCRTANQNSENWKEILPSALGTKLKSGFDSARFDLLLLRIYFALHTSLAPKSLSLWLNIEFLYKILPIIRIQWTLARVSFNSYQRKVRPICGLFHLS